LKVLIVHNANQQPAGDDVVVALETKLLQDAGHQVLEYRRSNWDVEKYTGLKKISLAARTVWAKDTKEDFARLLQQEKPDVVHVHNTFVMISPSIYSACVEAGIPVVQTLHNYRLLCPAATMFRDGKVCQECVQSSLLKSVQHCCYKGSRATTAIAAAMLQFHWMRGTWQREISCYIALSEFARSKMIEGGLPAHKVMVKPNFVSPDPGNHRTGIGDYAIFVGRLSPEKRVATILDAWKLLKSPVPIYILGGGPEEDMLRARVKQENIANVEIKGKIPREQTIAMLSNARFLVFPSEWYEGFPMTLAESFACGTPVICSRMGSMQEIVSDRRTGLHFTPGDAADLARAVEWAWAHPQEMRAMGAEARNDYEQKYTAEKNYPMLMNIYRHAMNGKMEGKWQPA
jgi:glycosyltransferase involved in cell wall biosynthesis